MNSINKISIMIIQSKFKNNFFSFIIFLILLVYSQSLKYFSSFYYFSGNSIILSDEGINFYNHYFKNMSEKIISTSNALGNVDEKSRIAFSKFPSDSVANYTICTFGLNTIDKLLSDTLYYLDKKVWFK